MPIVNHVVLASGAAVAVSMAVATAVAMYESPELWRYADDIRRRIAVALHSMGDGIQPPHREPRFNRPEDADGFLQSSRGVGAQPGVDADEESRRRQREELLYWNRLLVDKRDQEQARPRAQDQEQQDQDQDQDQDQAQEQAQEQAQDQDPTHELPAAPAPSHVPRPPAAPRGPSFDDFLRQDEQAEEQGTYVFNTGSHVRGSQSGLRHRGEPARHANPFADEYCITNDALGRDDAVSDMYSATTRDADDFHSATLEPSPPPLIDVVSWPHSASTLERELAHDEYMSAGQDDSSEAYASIQAWAHDSSRNFYSPLPVTPASEPELVSDGQLTPTDSASLAGSGHDVANEAQSSAAGETGRPWDVMSESEGMLTPASWSEIGSVISESDAHGPMRA